MHICFSVCNGNKYGHKDAPASNSTNTVCCVQHPAAPDEVIEKSIFINCFVELNNTNVVLVVVSQQIHYHWKSAD